MFGKKAEEKIPSSIPESPVKTEDMIVRVMPKDFSGKTVSPAVVVPQASLPPRMVVAPPAAAPRPVIQPVPQPVQQPVMVVAAPKPGPVTPPPPRRKFGLIIFLFLLLLLMAGGGIGLYYYMFLMPVPVAVEPTPEPTPEPEPEPTPIPLPTEPVPGKDTDSDGLTDVEELLYGTDYRNPDTDGDTFLDGNEVFHRYHPNGSAPSTLLDTGTVRIFQGTDGPFTIYYPSSWTSTADATENKVSFRSPSTAAIIITWQAKPPTESLEVWYQHTIPNNSAASLEPTYTQEGLLALAQPGERIAYVDGGDKVFVLTYDLGDETTIEFLTTFQMMLNSLKLLP
jgi:hypothetical protein